MEFKDIEIGQKVTVKRDIIELATGEHPTLLYATPGEILIVRKKHPSGHAYAVSISHEDVIDNSFGVALDEIEPVNK